MTLVAAITGSDGLALFADTEATVGDYSKQQMEKIKCMRERGAEFSYAIGTATDSDEYVQMLEWDLRYEIMSQFKSYEPEQIHEVIKQYLQDFHAKHIWPRVDAASAPKLHSLIVLHPNSSTRALPLLLHTTETAVNVVREPYCCIGVGAHLANFILKHLIQYCGGSKAHLLAVAAYTLQKVHQDISQIGPPGDIYYFTNRGPHEVLSKDSDQYKAMLNRIEPMTDVLCSVVRYMTDVTSEHLGTDESLDDLSIEIAEERSAIQSIFDQERARAEEYRRQHPPTEADDELFKD